VGTLSRSDEDTSRSGDGELLHRLERRY